MIKAQLRTICLFISVLRIQTVTVLAMSIEEELLSSWKRETVPNPTCTCTHDSVHSASNLPTLVRLFNEVVDLSVFPVRSRASAACTFRSYQRLGSARIATVELIEFGPYTSAPRFAFQAYRHCDSNRYLISDQSAAEVKRIVGLGWDTARVQHSRVLSQTLLYLRSTAYQL